MRRELGFWENTCKFGHDQFAGTGNVLSAARLEGYLNYDRIVEALRMLFNQHPLLRATLGESNYRPYFIINNCFENIPITFIPLTHDWLSAFPNALKEKFITDRYLWRAIIQSSEDQQNHVLIFIFHHAISDGLSAVTFIKQFLSKINQYSIPSKPLPLLPSIEEQLNVQQGWNAFIDTKKKLQQFSSSPWEYEKFVRPTERVTQCIYRELSEQQLSNLYQKAKNHHVTLNSILNAAALCATQFVKGSEFNTFLHTPINLRPYCQPPLTDEHIGCYISMVTTEHQLTLTDCIWELAKDYQTQLKASIPTLGFCPKHFNIADFDIETLAVLFEMPGSSKRSYFSGGFGISNLGKIQLEPELTQKFQIKHLVFCTHRAMGDYVIFLNVVTLKDKMQLLFCYCEPLISKETAELWVERFMGVLLNRGSH